MMNLPAPSFVFGVLRKKGCCSRDSLQKHIDAHRKIRAVNETSVGRMDRLVHRRKMLEPPCRPRDRIDTKGSKSAQIIRRGIRRSELHRGSYAAQRIPVDPGIV